MLLLRRALILLPLLAMTAACGAPRDPVRALLDELVEAAEDRDADAIVELFTDDISAGGQDKAGAERLVRQSLAAYRSLDVTLSGIESVRKAGSARVTLRAHLSGVPRDFGGLGDLVPRSATYDFSLTLREEPAGWRISQVEWSEPSSS